MIATAQRSAPDRDAATIAMQFPRRGPPLSEREQTVLLLVARGHSNAQIANELVISQHTVVSHVRSIFNKTGAHNRTQAARFAYRAGLAK